MTAITDQLQTLGLDLPFSLDLLDTELLLTAAIYLGLAGAFLLVMPLAVYFYLQKRWYAAGSIERVIMYFFMFFFFPGILLLSPFLNFRPRPRPRSA
ncbi:MAG: NAD(P)H-quinone oxidoreductase subunit L [Prochlorothrix sp.]|nr:NAD(P)H-quinone oxidoreductase subunit L [Prochlorothrix sp.]